MKRYKTEPYLLLQPSGHGHYAMATTLYNKPVTMVTSDMPLIDRIKEGSQSAKMDAIKMIRYENRKTK
jgi:hypothetical protein